MSEADDLSSREANSHLPGDSVLPGHDCETSANNKIDNNQLTNSETQTDEHRCNEQHQISSSDPISPPRSIFYPNDGCINNNEWIMLNVGGKIFTTTRTTLCTNEPNSMLARMFSQDNHHQDSSLESQTIDSDSLRRQEMIFSTSTRTTLRPSPRDASGAYMIDRSPKYFEPILNYLRHGKLIIDHDVNVQGVLEEAKFYGIVSLLPMLELETERLFKSKHHKLLKSQQQYEKAQNNNNNSDENNHNQSESQQQQQTPLTRQEVIKAIISTSATNELRFQGCNLARADLSKLDLRHINFKYADLEEANLKGANLSFANLERANLIKANLEGSVLVGANLTHANLKNSNLRAITIIGDSNRVFAANFEGANLSYSNLEGSRLAGANLRVARMKFANLQNCDLSGAILVGADLENCDLSGSDLNEANLRKANVKGVQFELEVL